MGYKPLPVGVEDFEKLITRGYYYVDKTLLIRELLDKKGDVNLFTRPRRFGKTLNMSMLRYFLKMPELRGENGKVIQICLRDFRLQKQERNTWHIWAVTR